MKAVRNAPPTVEVVDVDEPVGDGVLVRVASAGICASDLMYLGFGSTQIAGHEFAGVTEDGVAVAVEAIFGCDACEMCERGEYNMCVKGPTGLGMTDPGAMCEWYRAPSRSLRALPEALSVTDACLVEPTSVALHACHGGSINADTSVAVVGGGAIGILAAASAQLLGAPEVAVESRYAHQREAVERIGAGTPTTGYDVVVETAGSESGLRRALDLVRPGGTVVYLGVYPGAEWPHQEAFMKEVNLRASLGYCGYNGKREFAESAEMLAARPELAETLITHRFPIADAAEAFRVASDRSQGVFRVVIEP